MRKLVFFLICLAVIFGFACTPQHKIYNRSPKFRYHKIGKPKPNRRSENIMKGRGTSQKSGGLLYKKKPEGKGVLRSKLDFFKRTPRVSRDKYIPAIK